MIEEKRRTGPKSKYTDELLEKAEQYAQNHLVDGSDDLIPSMEALAVYLGVTRKTLYEWRKHPEKQAISDIFDRVMANQARILINRGLEGTFNSTITKVILTKHGFNDKVEQDITSSDGSMAMPTVIKLEAPE